MLSSNPSISVRSWLMVLAVSSFPYAAFPLSLAVPMASNSSMKMMHGRCVLACSNRFRTLLAPTPTNISMNSEPAAKKKGTFASPAIARARSVLPVPGGPTISTPAGSCAPSFR